MYRLGHVQLAGQSISGPHLQPTSHQVVRVRVYRVSMLLRTQNSSEAAANQTVNHSCSATADARALLMSSSFTWRRQSVHMPEPSQTFCIASQRICSRQPPTLASPPLLSSPLLSSPHPHLHSAHPPTLASPPTITPGALGRCHHCQPQEI